MNCDVRVAVHVVGILRTTVPLVSGTPSDFGIMLPLVPVVKILKKKWSHRENLGERGGQTKRELTEKSVNFSTLATSNIRFLVKPGSINETSPIGEKKIHDHRRKTRGNDNFLMKQSPFLSPNFIRGFTVIVIPHNVELCKQYFLQERLLLIRKSCN